MNETTVTPFPKTLWHRLLATLLEELLSPVGIQVYTDLPLLSKPPEADILLLRRHTPHWTPEQLLRLPDGIRESQASHILIEFKYTESVNEEAFLQTLSYDTIYKRAKRLKATHVQTVLVSSKTPQTETLIEWGYAGTHQVGVYRSQERSMRLITLLSLNELSAEPHNAFLKTFASRPREKRKAFAIVGGTGLSWLTAKLQRLLAGLQTCWFSDIGEDFMKQQLTPKKVMAMGEQWFSTYLAQFPVEERLKLVGLTTGEQWFSTYLAQFPVEERLKLVGLTTGEQWFSTYLAQFPVEERLKLVGLTTQERLAGLSPQERLSGLTPAEIETHLRQLQSQSTVANATKRVVKTRSSRP